MGTVNIWHFIFIVIVTQQVVSGDEIRLDQSPAVIKKPTEQVKISCKISGFKMTSFYMHWIRQKPGKALEWIGRVNSGSSGDVIYADSMKDHFILSEDVSASTQYLEAKSLREEDTAVYYCARPAGGRNAFDYWGKGTMVTVTSAEPSAPQYLFGLTQCGAASDGFFTLGCMARGFTPADSLSFKWTDPTGKQVTDFVQYPTLGLKGESTKFSHLRVSKSNWDPKNSYKCEAANTAGKKEISVVPSAPPPDHPASVYLTTPTKMELESGTATFICLAKQFSPEQHSFKWLLNNVVVKDGVADDCLGMKKTNVTLYTATSTLQLNAEMWKPGTKITCEFEHRAGNETKETSYSGFSTDACITANFIPPSWEDMFKDKSGTLKCKASGEIGFKKIEIKTSGRTINESSEESLKNKRVVELEARISFEEWSNGMKFLCSIEHESTAQPTEILYTREKGGDRKRPSVYILAPPEQREGETMTLTCYVKDFYPKEVFVSWLANDEYVLPEDGYMQNTSMPMFNNDYFSVYSQLTFSASKWKDGTLFSCVVYHESIHTSLQTLTRSIHNNSEKPSIINLSLNTPTCKTV